MKTVTKIRHTARLRRHQKVRMKISGTKAVPRLSVFRSHRYLWAQIIDDAEAKTLVAVSDREIKKKGTKQEKAQEAGALLAKKAKDAGISRVRFDRGGFRYHGRIKAFADAARKGGLEF